MVCVATHPPPLPRPSRRLSSPPHLGPPSAPLPPPPRRPRVSVRVPPYLRLCRCHHDPPTEPGKEPVPTHSHQYGASTTPPPLRLRTSFAAPPLHRPSLACCVPLPPRQLHSTPLDFSRLHSTPPSSPLESTRVHSTPLSTLLDSTRLHSTRLYSTPLSFHCATALLHPLLFRPLPNLKSSALQESRISQRVTVLLLRAIHHVQSVLFRVSSSLLSSSVVSPSELAE
jgi:hypothetical protein